MPNQVRLKFKIFKGVARKKSETESNLAFVARHVEVFVHCDDSVRLSAVLRDYQVIASSTRVRELPG